MNSTALRTRQPLKTTISELKQASEHDVTHLKTVISELKQAAEREETHLKEVIADLNEVIERLQARVPIDGPARVLSLCQSQASGRCKLTASATRDC